MKVKIVGNGIASLMLAEKLKRENVEVIVLGSGPSQAPPQIMVHLYAGRSFRRSNLEIEAFKESVNYWRVSPYSTETKVNRYTNPRLERSLSQTKAHPWDSPVLEDGIFSYGPSFVVDTNGLMEHLRQKVEYRNIYIENQKSNELQDCDHVVWATGFRNERSYCVLNTGASITVQDSDTPSQIRIGKGVHHASNSTMSSVGGAFLNKSLEEPKAMLLQRAKNLIPKGKEANFENGELFIGKKSVSADRLPVIGPDENGDFLFTAFGARAFFWLPSSSKLAYNLLSGQVIDSPFSPLRFLKEKI